MSLLTQRNTGQFRFNSLTDLRALSGENLKAGEIVFLSSASPSADGSERTYVWNTSSTDTDDGEVTIKLTDTDTGRLKLYGAFKQSGTGATPRTMLDKARESVSAKDWATGDGSTDDTVKLTAAIAAVAGTSTWLDLGDGEYRITSGLTLNIVKLRSRGAKILKDFDGVALTITGGASYFEFEGDLIVEGHGDYAADGSAVSTSAAAHGIVVSGTRLKIGGNLQSNGHQGNGWQFNATGNANKSVAEAIWAHSNAGYGMRFSGTDDNQSVWKIRTYTQYNYEGGAKLDADYTGRNWEWFCYNEGSQNAAGAAGVDLGRLRDSRLFVYSEEQTLAGPEILIGAACANVEIMDARSNRTTNNSSSVVTKLGAQRRYRGFSGEVVDGDFFENLTESAARTVVRRHTASGGTLLDEVFNGIGKWFMRAQNRAATLYHSIGADRSEAEIVGHGSSGKAVLSIYSSKGTPAAPSALTTSEDFSEIKGWVNTTGAAFTHGYSIKGETVTVGGGNKATCNMVFGVSSDAAVTTERMTLQGATGRLAVPAGVIIQSPDATNWLISVDNAGAISATAV